MRKTVLLLIPVLLCLITHPAWAEDPKELASAFLTKVKAGTINEAYDGLFEGSGIPEMKPQAVDMLKRQTASGLPMYGKILGFEMLHEEAFGSSIVRLVYVLKQEEAATIWQFFFYKPKDSWFLGNVIFNDQFQYLQKMK